MVASLFPRCPQDWPKDLSRLLAKRMEAGDLSLTKARLITRLYKVATQSPDDPRPWKAHTIREFLSASRLGRAHTACLSACREEIGYAEIALQSWKDDDSGKSQIASTVKLLRGPDPFPIHSWLEDSPAIALMLCRPLLYPATAKSELRDQIQQDLSQHPYIREFYLLNDTKLPSPIEMFGFSDAEIQQFLQEEEAKLVKQLNDLKSLI